MEKHFCDRCEREIKGDVEWIFGKELCEDCCEKIEYFINNPDAIISNPKFEKEREETEYEKIFAKGDKIAIAHFKMEHGYTMSKEDLDILNEDRVDPCEGLTCYMPNGDGSYTLCPELTTETNVAENYRYYNCQKKGTGIAIPERDIVEDTLVIEPGAFNGEEF